MDRRKASALAEGMTPARNPPLMTGRAGTLPATAVRSRAEPGTPGAKSNTRQRDFVLASFRAVEGKGNERKFTLSFSSEEPVARFWGNEVLDHSDGAVDLSRLNEIGVLLFNHNRDAVIGKINRAWIENRRGCAEVEFDTDEQSEIIFQKVRSGTLKGVSTGYRIDSIEEVLAGKSTADGRFTGPAEIARKWCPYEISIVSVPADSTVGVGRDIDIIKPTPLEIFERQLQINRNIIGG